MLRIAIALFGAAMLLTAGCGGQEYAEVEGVVTRNGKPLDNLQVIFMPDPELGTFGPSSRAFTDEEGRYHVMSVRGQDGAVVGLHRVCIKDISGMGRGSAKAALPSSPSSGNRSQSAIQRVPPFYGNSTATPLKNVEVKPGRQTFDIEIK